jgi:hypothetical protein
VNADRGHARQRWAALAASLVAAVVVLGPALGPGFVLLRDMVFVPRQPLTGSLLGLAAQAPRAVPSDAVVALLGTVLPGQLVQKLVLLAVLVAAGTGTGLLVRLHPAGAVAAAVASVWNPYVAERLAAGQWAVLVGYAAVPWVARAAWRWAAVAAAAGSAAARAARGSLVVAVVLGSLGGAPAWVLVALAGLGGYLVGAGRRWFGTPLVTLGALLALTALPWAVPALLRPGGVQPDAAGVVFSPRPDTPLGVVGSLLTGGGIWNADVVPAGRDSAVGALGALLLLAAAVAGLALAVRPLPAPPRPRPPADTAGVAVAIVLAGLVGLLLAVAALPAVLGDRLAASGAFALLRDGARQVGPWVVATSLGVGLLGDRLAASTGALRRAGGAGLAALVALLPAAVLPSVAWGLWGMLQAVDYPADYASVASRVAGTPGAVVVLPFEAYRRFTWNGSRPSLDPLPRWLDTVVVASSDLVVRRTDGSAVRVRGEDPFAAEVGKALVDPAPAARLGRLGVSWVVVDVSSARVPDGLTEAWRGSHLALFSVPAVDPRAAADPGGRRRPPRGWVVGGDSLWALGVVLGIALARPSIAARRTRLRSAPRAAEPGDTLR